MSSKKGLLIIAVMIMCMVIGCSANKKEQSNNKSIEGEHGEESTEQNSNLIGKTGKCDYEGVTFTYKIEESGAVITNIEPIDVEEIVMPNTFDEINIVEIDDEIVFSKYTNLQKISLPEGVSTISERAFEGCEKLRRVEMYVKTINDFAFKDCVSLEEVKGYNIEYVGEGAFSNCISLYNINLKAVQVLGKEAFCGCVSMSWDMEFDKLALTDMGEDVFKGCTGLEGAKFTFGKGKQEINEYTLSIVHELYDMGIQGLITVMRGYEWAHIWRFSAWMGESAGNDIDASRDSSILKCSGHEMYKKVAEVFDLKILKDGESISIKEIYPILKQIKDDGNTTYTHTLNTKAATKYRMVEALKIGLILGKGIETLQTWNDELGGELWDSKMIGLEKKIIYDEAGNAQYKYSELSDDMIFTNSTGKNIIFFCTDLTEYDYGVSFWLSAAIY